MGLVGGYSPLMPMVAYIRFEFPEGVKYPCIPVNGDGMPIYPRTSKGFDGIYACGPEIYLALRLGAKVYCEKGYVLNPLRDKESGEVSYSLRAAVKQLVSDRNDAKRIFGLKSLEELILKTMVNSGYGKVAQNVSPKTKYCAKSEGMEDVGESPITNPVSAAMITSIVRAELLAAQNQVDELEYMTCSVTTDGFISDVPEETLKSLDLLGFRKWVEQSRLFLTDNKDRELWETKHRQDDLVNFTTRGNVSLWTKDKNGYDGVCAHNGGCSPYRRDSYEDRKWLMKEVVSRE